MAIVRFNPVNEVMNLQREMDRWVERFFPVGRGEDDAARSAVWRPVVDIHETDTAYVIDAELPGMRKEDVTINYQDGVLTVSGERRYSYEDPAAEAEGTGNGNTEGRVSTEKKNTCHRLERYYGRFHRSFSFPTAVNPEQISARFENGVLKVTVPKAEQVRPRQIDIA
jgi:HSP20 family protein